MLLSSHLKFLEFHLLFTERDIVDFSIAQEFFALKGSHSYENLRFEITEPIEPFIFISLVTLELFLLSKDI